jgi:hypothetical protein
MRRFQLVAPDEKRWQGLGIVCCPVEWAKGIAAPAIKFNQDAFKDALSILSHGLESIPEDEKDFYATD